ncbi:hypothetical protein AVR82_17450 (plasmid) [Lactiplantibacillus plantarum]|nr:hypothetical protein AVR82_17450 [Lactiplantibacillus plantarum]
MFANLIKAIDNDWKGYSQALYKNDQINVSTILHDHFKDESFDKDQYVSFFSDLGYSPVTIKLELNKLVFDNTIAKVGPDRLMFTELLNISHEEQLQIDKYLLICLIQQQGILALNARSLTVPSYQKYLI